MISCNKKNRIMNNTDKNTSIAFLHHSTGKSIWQGGNSYLVKIKGKLGASSAVEKWFSKYNRKNGVNYQIREIVFPKKDPYGWKNYPFDYYNIWVKNGDELYYKEEPTLKTLTIDSDVIIFKHCFPVSRLSDEKEGDINSDRKTITNYKLQYEALYAEFQKYPNVKFIVWTPAALTESKTTVEQAGLTRQFSNWVKEKWDKPGDNVFVWDFFELETEGGLYLKEEYAVNSKDSHPNDSFARKTYPRFCQYIVDVIENRVE
ncbi:hypothetical protein DMA11_12495 [Marinilabiliaceae bacterium JC017]|nr:hypothetical protein DMA11_12495 [Marinilabiliaceae bacterium JC017]